MLVSFSNQIIYKATLNTMTEVKVLTEEKLVFTRNFLLSANIGLLIWVFLAFFSVFLHNQIAGWLYLLCLSFLIYVILRRLGCSSCYKCASCTSGFGRLAGVFFGKGFMKKESIGNRLVFVVFIYTLLFPLPLVTLAFSLFNLFSYVKIIVLINLLIVTIYSFSTWSTVQQNLQRHDLGQVLNG